MDEALCLAVIGRGRMGRRIEEVAAERGHRVRLSLGSGDNPGGAALTREALEGVDVALEFSAPEAAATNVERALGAGVGVVCGTTGWASAAELERLGALADERGVGLVVAPNFALGVLLLRSLVRRAAELAGGDELFDLWIEEAHHAAKRDAPSGTALALADDVLAHHPRKTRVRTEGGPAAGPDELSVRSTRGGFEPGLHRVVIDAPDESIELVHRARSRRVFALGAVRAAEWIRGRRGLQDLASLVDSARAPG